jgi:hypothetical protein
MEAVAYVAGERWSDRPQCASPVIAAFVRRWNDHLDPAQRQVLKTYIPRLVGSRGTAAEEVQREWMALDWLVHDLNPMWLRVAGLADLADVLVALPEIGERPAWVTWCQPTVATVAAAARVHRDNQRGAFVRAFQAGAAGQVWTAWSAGAVWAAGAAGATDTAWSVWAAEMPWSATVAGAIDEAESLDAPQAAWARWAAETVDAADAVDTIEATWAGHAAHAIGAVDAAQTTLVARFTERHAGTLARARLSSIDLLERMLALTAT